MESKAPVVELEDAELDPKEQERIDAIRKWATNPSDANLDRVIAMQRGNVIDGGLVGEPSALGGRRDESPSPHSRRPSRPPQDSPVFPDHLLRKAVETKLREIAKGILEMKREAERAARSDASVQLGISHVGRYLEVPVEHERFSEIVVYFLFYSMNDTQVPCGVSFHRNGVDLPVGMMNAGSILRAFGLQTMQREFLKKRAVHRVVSKHLDRVEAEVEVRKEADWKSEAGIDNLDFESVVDAVTGMANAYNMEAYSYVEGLRKVAMEFIETEQKTPRA